MFRILADAVSSGVGVGPGWMPAPDFAAISIIAGTAIVLSAALGAVALQRIATRTVADLVRAE